MIGLDYNMQSEKQKRKAQIEEEAEMKKLRMMNKEEDMDLDDGNDILVVVVIDRSCISRLLVNSNAWCSIIFRMKTRLGASHMQYASKIIQFELFLMQRSKCKKL